VPNFSEDITAKAKNKKSIKHIDCFDCYMYIKININWQVLCLLQLVGSINSIRDYF